MPRVLEHVIPPKLGFGLVVKKGQTLRITDLGFLYESYGLGPRDGCHENISKAVAAYGLLPEDIPDTMDLFMNYHHDCAAGHWVIEPGVSKPGDYVEFEAVMDCVVALSNCPFFDGKEIKVEVLAA